MGPSLALALAACLWLVDAAALLAIAERAHPPLLRAWQQPFFLSDSVSDLAALALARGLVLLALLGALHSGRAEGGGLTPLAAPLLDPAADRPAATARSPRARAVLAASRAWHVSMALYALAKCLVRLVAGPPAQPGARTDEGLFWAALGASVALAFAEHSALCAHRLLARARPGGADGAPPARRTRLADVLSLCAPDWPLFVQAFCGLTVAAAGESLIPYLYGEILNSISSPADPNAFRTPMLQLVLTAAVTGLATGVRGSTFTVLGARFSTRLRQRLLDALLRAELGFFDVTKTGEISSRLSADCQKVGDQIELNVNVFVRSLLQVALTTAAMVAINWRLGLVAFVSVPPIVVASRVFGAFIRELTKSYQKALADSTAVAEEALGAMRTVRAFAAEADVSAAYGRDMARYRSLVYREAAAYFAYSALTFTFLPYCCACLVLFYGAQLVHQGGMKAGQLVSFVFYLQALQASFNSLASIYTGLTQAVGAADKVFEWIERTPQIRPRGALRRADLRPAAGVVELRSVHFAYPARLGAKVLRGVSLRAEPGEVLALCGQSGGGKSSILALVQRWYDADQGAVLLDGVDVRDYDSGWFHHNLSVVSQEPTLFSRTIRENVLLGLTCPQPLGPRRLSSQRGGGRSFGAGGGAGGGGSAGGGGADGAWMQAEVEEACREANAHDFITAFPHGYDTEVGEKGVQLSGGQKQRIAIARALVRRPRVLLLDEATSALDSESEALVQGAIDAMIGRSGGQMTVLVIAHRLSTIRNASRIAVVSGGAVAEVGTHDELLARNGPYAALVRMQLGRPSAARGGSRAEGLAEMGAEPKARRAGGDGAAAERIASAPSAEAESSPALAHTHAPSEPGAAAAPAARGCGQQ